MTIDIRGPRPDEIDPDTWLGLQRIMRAPSTSGPAKQPTICPHRGEVARLIECPSCNGSIKIKVFFCSKHGECQISGKIAGIHVCDG